MRVLLSFTVWFLAVAFSFASGKARAAQIASDNASQSAYADGWQSGDNGGSGFGPWTITPAGAGLIGSSTANGDAQLPAGDIDTAGSHSWALAFNPSAFAPITAVRPLTGSLNSNQHISFDIDGFCTSPNSEFMHVRLGTAASDRWYLEIRPSAIGFVGSTQSLIVPGTPEGLHVDFTLTGPDTYSASVNVLGAQPTVFTGTLAGTTGSIIDQISLGFSPSLNPTDVFYVNNLAVTPEPSGALLLLYTFAKIAVRRRPRH